jgi:Spy/CpxP family protein refolding chaperone
MPAMAEPLRSNPLTALTIPALELHMQYPSVSTLVIVSAFLATGFGPALAAKDGDHGTVYDRICATPTEHVHHHKLAERLAKHLNLTDTQKAAYKEFVDARTKAVDDQKTALCATKPDLTTFESRITFHQNMLEARLAALKEENPKLLAFYKSLDAGQKEKFDNFRNDRDRE